MARVGEQIHFMDADSSKSRNYLVNVDQCGPSRFEFGLTPDVQEAIGWLALQGRNIAVRICI